MWSVRSYCLGFIERYFTRGNNIFYIYVDTDTNDIGLECFSNPDRGL